jgi:hypothetical protein
MTNGDRWAVSVRVIAENRARVYIEEHDGDLPRALDNTVEFFESEYEIEDWAANNMNWDDVKEHAFLYEKNSEPIDWQESWVNGEHEILDRP